MVDLLSRLVAEHELQRCCHWTHDGDLRDVLPLQHTMKAISVDDHLIEHPELWQDRLPRKFCERGPRIRELQTDMEGYLGTTVPAGAQVWHFEDRIYPHTAMNAVAGRPQEERNLEPYRYDEIRKGCYDPQARLNDMDIDGVWGSLCFPTFPRFAGTLFLEAKDPQLGLACVRAWNDYVLDEWCATAPERLVPLVIVPLWDVSAAVAEVERTANRGARTISFPENPVPLGLPSFHSDHWDALFDAASSNDMPLSVHFGTSGRTPVTAPDAPYAVKVSLVTTNSMSTAMDLVFSRVFLRFPGLKVALSEGGIGWIPYITERADQTWEKLEWERVKSGDPGPGRPSNVFREHIFGCFIDDETGVRDRARIGLSNIMWESDYPHSDSNWPHSRQRLEEMLRDVSDDDAHRIAELNARSLFRI